MVKIGIIGMGLIGYPIAQSLHEAGHEITSWTRKDRKFGWTNRTDFRQSEIADLDFLIVASGSARPSYGGVETELESTFQIVSKTFNRNDLRIIYLSSGAVYGECAEAKTESDIPSPSTDYGFAKIAAEEAFSSVYGKNFCSLRIGNVVDWNSPYGVVKALREAKLIRRIEFFGDPEDCRDYISIGDMNNAILKIIETGVFPTALNVGSGISLKLNDLVTIINENSPSSIDITWSKIGLGHIRQTKLDITNLKSTLKIDPINPANIFKKYLLTEELCN